MPELNPIEARFRADLSELRKGFEQAVSGARETASRVTSTMSGAAVKAGAEFKKMGSGIASAYRSVQDTIEKVNARFKVAVLAATATLTLMVRGALESADALKNQAQALDANAAKLATYKVNAQLAGVAEEKFANSIRKMVQDVGAAAEGTGEAAESLKKLNLNASELINLRSDQQFERIAEQINKLSTQSERVSVAAKIFGDRDGPAMLNMIRLMGEGATVTQGQLEAMNVVLSQPDLEKLDRAGDALDLVKVASQGVSNTLALALSPIIAKVGEDFFNATAESKGFRDEINGAVDAAITGAGIMSDGLHGVQILIKMLAVGFQGLGTTILSIFSQVYEGWTRIVSAIASAIPGMDGVVKQLDAAADAQTELRERMVSSTAQSFQELQDKLNEPLPSESLKAWVAEARAAADEAAKAAAEATGAGGGGTGGSTKAAEEFRKNVEERLEALREGLSSEVELLNKRYQEEQKLLLEAQSTGVIGTMEYHELLEELEQEHQDNLYAIRLAGGDAIQRMVEQFRHNDVQGALETGMQLTANFSRHSRKLFELNKVFGISNAIVSAYQGIAKTLAEYPFPLSAAMAAAQAGIAFAQVAAIKGTSFGGGGGAPSLAATTPATPVSPVGGPTTLIRLSGDTFSRQSVEGLLDQLNEGGRDGGRVVVLGGG